MHRTLRGITWDHPRGVASVRAATAAFTRVCPNVTIVWTARPLVDFEDIPVRLLAREYDLIALDHPFVAGAASEGHLVELDGTMDKGVMAERRVESVGPSHRSYSWGGKQWALAMDAAAQVSACRADLLSSMGREAPSRWDEVVDFMEDLRGRGYGSVIAACPTHLFLSLLSLCQAEADVQLSMNSRVLGSDPEEGWWREDGLVEDVAVPALSQLRRLLGGLDPICLQLNPIQALDLLSGSESVAYAPLVFGYVTYAVTKGGRRAVTFKDVPTGRSGVGASTLGGVGIAVSARSMHQKAAVEFVRFVTSAECQRGPYVEGGGQPGHRAAWTDTKVNARSNGFFRDTLATVENGFVRPMTPYYPKFQRVASRILHRLVSSREPELGVVRKLNRLWVVRGGEKV